MARRTAVFLEVEQKRLDREIRRFLRDQLPEAVNKAVRLMAFGVVQKVMKLLNGLAGLPKRIDTGRLRAGWRVALANGDLPTFGLPGRAPTSEDTDGSAKVEGDGLTRTVTVQNRVAYARYVEFGTRRMRAGKHLETALRLVRSEISGPSQDELRKGVQRAWRS